MARPKKTAEAAPAKETAKTAKAAVEAPVKAAETVTKAEPKAAPAKKTAAKKAAPKKVAPKKPTQPETKVTFFVEYNGKQVSIDEVINNVKLTNGKDASELVVYLKPEEQKAYFVADGEEKEMDVFFC